MHSKKEAFVELMQENKGIIYKICRSYCADTDVREDLAQEIVYHLWKSFENYNPAYKFSTWMYRIALNVAISSYRKASKHLHHIPIDVNLVLFEDMPDDRSDMEKNIRQLEKFISELGDIDKSIMLLYLDDKSYKEIASIVGIRETNVATKINRIKIKLKTNFITTQNN